MLLTHYKNKSLHEQSHSVLLNKQLESYTNYNREVPKQLLTCNDENELL